MAATPDETPGTTVAAPRMEVGRALLIAGIGEHYTFEDLAGIPTQWRRFQPYFGFIPGQIGSIAFGVCYNSDGAGGFDYLTGVEVGDFAALPKELARVRVSEHRYAVFRHGGHVSTTRGTFMAIFGDWLPKLRLEMADAPLFERYDERFDPQTGMGGFEICIPVQA